MKVAGKRTLGVLAGVSAIALVATGCLSSGGGGGGGSGKGVTIKAILPPNTGEIGSAQNKALSQYTHEYESAHPNVTVNWLPNPTSSITTANATLVSQAAGGNAPDIVFEQYNPLLSGSIPNNVLQDLRPYLNKPNPYIKGNKKWIDSFQASTVPYMTSPDGSMRILLGSNVETAFYYNKAAFAKAKISGAPATWADLMQDLGKLKS
ncbi:MAG: ABC transporter substrate-binding protein, partial [Pseudonocardiaceae bacterium]